MIVLYVLLNGKQIIINKFGRSDEKSDRLYVH